MRLAPLGTAALILSLGVAGCGGTADSDKTAAFVGPWTVTTGAVAGNCTGLPPIDYKLDGGVQVIAKGTGADLAVTLLMGCVVKMNVTGTVATALPGQSCMIMLPNGLGVTATVTSGAFTVADKTASFTFMGTVMLGALSCPVMGAGSSMKGLPPDAGTGADAAAVTGDGP